MTILSSLFYFLVAIGVLIAIHEYGHFWVARKLGVKVLRYSIGFGKPLWMRRRGPDQTEYVVAALPVGGYVRMLDEREGPVAEQERHRAFNRQPLAKRFAIVAAGPLSNFLLAIAAYWLVFMFGITVVKPMVGEVVPDSAAARGGFMSGDVITSVDHTQTDGWQSVVLTLLDSALTQTSVPVKVHDAAGDTQERVLDLHSVSKDMNQGDLLKTLGIQPYQPILQAVVGVIEPGEPAAQAGLKVGDKILKCDGKPIADWEAWVNYVRAHPGQSIRMEIERNGEHLTLDVTPRLKKEQGGEYGYVGVGVATPQGNNQKLLSVVRYSPLVALGKAATKTWDMSALTVRMLWGMVSGRVSVSNISGPISIAKYAGYTAHAGALAFLSFLAIVSLSLGVLNLLPIPVLDGGHLFYYVIEFVKGSPLSEEAQALGQRIGIAILLVIMAIAFYNDITQLVE
ncbi:MAG: RIP metalloprotease RseP [Gammaproteobacteria bacterium]|jgi:regulator of sigma E protease